MKTAWAMGLALCLAERTAAAQLAWRSDDYGRRCSYGDPDLVRAGVHATPDGALAEGARPAVVATGDVDGDGREDEFLVVRPRATPYPQDRRAGAVLRLHRADGWTAEVMARGVRESAPTGEREWIDNGSLQVTVEPALVFGARMFPVLTVHIFHDHDPHGWWERETVILAPRSADAPEVYAAGELRRLAPTRLLLTTYATSGDMNGVDSRLLTWDGSRFRVRQLSRLRPLYLP